MEKFRGNSKYFRPNLAKVKEKLIYGTNKYKNNYFKLLTNRITTTGQYRMEVGAGDCTMPYAKYFRNNLCFSFKLLFFQNLNKIPPKFLKIFPKLIQNLKKKKNYFSFVKIYLQ